jgi:hypothetical protein
LNLFSSENFREYFPMASFIITLNKVIY